jgi:hypothetical protein
MEHQKSGEPTSNTVRRTTDEPDALDTTPTSEPLADQPKDDDDKDEHE